MKNERETICRLAKERDEFVQDVDGFVYWWPMKNYPNHLSAHHLRYLADELDRINEPWQARIEAELTNINNGQQ